MAHDVLAIDLEELKRIAMTDPVYTKLLNKVKIKSFMKTSAMEDPDIRPFNVGDRLSICDNLLMYTFEEQIPRLVIPLKLQKRVQRKLHAAHQGASTILSRARQTVCKCIEEETGNCKQCYENATSQSKLPLLPSPIPQYPMQFVDICLPINRMGRISFLLLYN